MNKMRFLMVVHNHQPCDNFGWVFEDAYNKSYKPFIDVLKKYPKVKVAIHYSGSLLEWLCKNKPDFIQSIKTLVKRRQVELLTGGFYEPILPVIPDRDKVGQIQLLTDFIKNYFEFVPKGIWFTERVWENKLSDIFSGQGFDYTIMDENHLKQAGVSDALEHTHYQLNNGLKVFAACKKLRYLIPFADIKTVFRYFKNLSEEKKTDCVLFADDGEKFGFWPHTFKWVYKRKWLERFFELLSDDNGPAESISFRQALELFRPKQIKDIPRSSYSEMMEWARGDFDNFFKIYPEANIMRNRMLHISDMVKEANIRGHHSTYKQKGVFNAARMELYKAQSGCAYWHGIFGGLYLNHLRSGVYKHLIKAQNLLEGLSAGRKLSIRECDFKNDSKDELVIGNRFIDLYLKPDEGGVVFELDNKKRTHNMINPIARRHEPYHSKLLGKRKPGLRSIKKDINENGNINIHDVLGVKHRGLRKYLIYDDHEKNSLVDYFILGKLKFRDYAKARSGNVLRISKDHYSTQKLIEKDRITVIFEKQDNISISGKQVPVLITKKISICEDPGFFVEYTLKNLSDHRLNSFFATEFNWSLMNRAFLRNRVFRKIDSFSIRDEWVDVHVKYSFSEAIKLWSLPIYTLNESEAGLEKTYQYLNLFIQWPVFLEKGKSQVFSAKVEVK